LVKWFRGHRAAVASCDGHKKPETREARPTKGGNDPLNLLKSPASKRPLQAR
jgi:hypothetical protein